MFPVNLIRHLDPEMFFATVAPVGADVRDGMAGLERILSAQIPAAYRLYICAHRSDSGKNISGSKCRIRFTGNI